jgi:hypothetical protein
VNNLGRRRLSEADKDHTDDGQANALLIEASSNATGYVTNHTLISAILDADNIPTHVFRVSMQPRTEVMVGHDLENNYFICAALSQEKKNRLLLAILFSPLRPEV